jgi:hypothetical protein
MTIAEAITLAMYGGYHIQGSDGVETYYSGANSDYSAWTRTDNASSFMVAVEETFLDPAFWQALGRALGHDEATEHGKLLLYSPTGTALAKKIGWGEYTMVRFVDHLATGKSPASFFHSFAVPHPGATPRRRHVCEARGAETQTDPSSMGESGYEGRPRERTRPVS